MQFFLQNIQIRILDSKRLSTNDDVVVFDV